MPTCLIFLAISEADYIKFILISQTLADIENIIDEVKWPVDDFQNAVADVSTTLKPI